MSNKIKLIKELLDYVDEFEGTNGDVDLKEFTLFLKGEVFLEKKPKKAQIDPKEYSNYLNYPEVEFSTLLTGLFRFAKHYLKKAFKNLSFKTIDEFGFLASLLQEGSMLKNELINRHMLEFSTGSEVLKRLTKSKLVVEHKDEKDGRAKRVQLSEKGRKELFSAFADMHKVANIVKGNLSENEISDALFVFNKLTFYHKNIHNHDRDSSLETVYEKYV